MQPAAVSAQLAARAAAVTAAAKLVEPGMTIGLGSGRTVWNLVEALGQRGVRQHVVAACRRTRDLARLWGLEVVDLDGRIEPDLVLDGADEVDPQLRLIKGGGGALLPEKILATATRRFVAVAESRRFVDRLGQNARLPVEVVRFGWPQTRRRILELLPGAELRLARGHPYLTEEGHHILDCDVPEGTELVAVDQAIKLLPGVVEHGLFIGLAASVVLGCPDGSVRVLHRRPSPG